MHTHEHRLFPTFPCNSANVTETKWGFEILLSSEQSDQLQSEFTSLGCVFCLSLQQPGNLRQPTKVIAGTGQVALSHRL